MSRKQFTINQTLKVSNGLETLPVTVYHISGRTINVRGPSICGHLKYFKNIENYSVSKGMSNGVAKKEDRYFLVA
jgi:hypothetical protein